MIFLARLPASGLSGPNFLVVFFLSDFLPMFWVIVFS
jgi:hypothetical protein